MKTLTALALLAVSIYAHSAPLEPYPTLEAAATAALTDAEALTPDFEAGGSLYACASGFVYDAPATSGKREGVDIVTYSYKGCTFAGTYHTHPRKRLVFSTDDIRSTCLLNVPGFMKPREGAVRMFDCRGRIYTQILAIGRPVYGEEI